MVVAVTEMTLVQSAKNAGSMRLSLLGPAFVAAIAYVDPGNVAANLSAGAHYGYLLVWVLVVANAMAAVVQYLSAKLGLVTGRSLPQLIGERLGRRGRLLFWLQAEVVAATTDIAEVIGGALALNLLFNTPLALGGLITGVIGMVILTVQNRNGQRRFEAVLLGMLAIITIGFLSGLFFTHTSVTDLIGGLVPRFAGTNTVLLAVGMIGATVMPHVIYLHSALARDRFGTPEQSRLPLLLRATRFDVGLALAMAGTVNIAMLALAASSLRNSEGTDTIVGAHAAINSVLGTAAGVAFSIGLLASGLASTSVGCAAGGEIMSGLLRVSIPMYLRRAITLIPAIILLSIGLEPTTMLIYSQVALSIGIPLALIPLIRLTSDRALMGVNRNGPWMRGIAATAAGIIVALNVVLVALTFS